MTKILLHTCCAPCTTYVYQSLKDQGFVATGYFYNPNIKPAEEYERRLESMRQYAEAVELIVIYESAKEPANKLRGSFAETETFSLRFPLQPKDCSTCYRVRLLKTAQTAKTRGFEYFSTTLLISPYQKIELLKKIGDEIGLAIGVKFFWQDFRPGYYQSRAMAKQLKLYRQKYCGCSPEQGKEGYAKVN